MPVLARYWADVGSKGPVAGQYWHVPACLWGIFALSSCQRDVIDIIDGFVQIVYNSFLYAWVITVLPYHEAKYQTAEIVKLLW